jgi:hypothetical protein
MVLFDGRHNNKRKRIQSGAGLFDGVSTSYKLLKAVLTIPQKYPGEHHTILQVGNDFKRAQYAGPGTNILERVRLGIKPLSAVDEISEAHDIDYSLADSVNDVRDADNKMISNLNKAQDKPFNIKQAELAIKGKIKLENLGVDPTAFASFGKTNTNRDDIDLLTKKRMALTQKGLGKKNQEEIEEYEKSIIKKPGQNLFESLVKIHSKPKKRFAKHIKKNCERVREIEDNFKSKKVPDSVLMAIKNMRI